MSAAIDLTGERFGKLTVLGRGANDRHGRAVWRCRCEGCGEIGLYVGLRLRRQGARKCWTCANPERRARHSWYAIPFDQLSYSGAHRRMDKLLPRVCAHCGTTTGRLDVAFLHSTPPEYRRISRTGCSYSASPDYYVRLCRTHCHRAYDTGRLRLTPRPVQTDLGLAA